MPKSFSIRLLLAFLLLFNQTSALGPLLSKYSIELEELPIRSLKKTLSAVNAKIRLLNTNHCFNWQGWSYNRRNKLSYSLELIDCDSIQTNDKTGHFNMEMTQNNRTNLFTTALHSALGSHEGCFGSSLDTMLSKKDPEDIEEYVYMRYCPTRQYPDRSTHWSLRPAVYRERKASYASPKEVAHPTNGVRRVIRTPYQEQIVSKSYVYRFEVVIDDKGERTHFCISQNDKGQIMLAECKPMSPLFKQWFEIIPDHENQGWKRKNTHEESKDSIDHTSTYETLWDWQRSLDAEYEKEPEN